jgi:hypothetical protein
MNSLFRLLLLLGWCAAASSAFAQRETIAVGAVKVTPAVSTKLSNAQKTLSAEQMSQSLMEQFNNSIQATRKFQVVVRSDLNDLITDDDKARALNPDKQKGFNLAETKYLTVLTVDDYDDQTQRLDQKLSNTTLTKRTIRLSLITKVYETASGKLLESTSKSISSTEAQQRFNEASTDAEITDALIRTVVKDAADWAATQIVDVIFPVKIITKNDKSVTVNRGEGSGIVVDQVWRVFAVGKELIDPDTKEVLGKEEVEIGKVRVTDVLPKFSKASILEDRGIAEGALLRK